MPDKVHTMVLEDDINIYMHVSFTVRSALLYFFKVCHYKTTLFTLKSIFILQAITVENEDYSEQL